MPEINILDKDTFSRIAAGEVVEKPQSVVKELMENSIDAGATEITVEIENGGLDLIKITDNGKGIRSDDLRRAFMPHATSKIKTTEDIFRISTLGFRGEALASVSSVSKVLLKSIHKEEKEGMEIYLEGGEEKYLKYSPVDRGTQVEVRNLFYNVPARMKFLKTPQREGTVIGDTVLRLALARPDIAVTYIPNGKETLKTFGTGNAEDVIRRVYNRKTAENVRFFKNDYEGYSIYGYIGNEELSRGSRNQQSIFINGRHISSRSLTAAVEQAFKSFITVSKFPFFILYLDIDPSSVDVNVHPQKAEVKFSDDRLMFKSVFDTVHMALREAYRHNLGFEESFLEKERTEVSQSYFSEDGVRDRLTGELTRDVKTGIMKNTDLNSGDELRYYSARESISGQKLDKGQIESTHNNQRENLISAELSEEKSSDFLIRENNDDRIDSEFSRLSSGKTPADIPLDLTNYRGGKEGNLDGEGTFIGTNTENGGYSGKQSYPASETSSFFNSGGAKFPELNIIGQFNKTYILAEALGILYLIDQHAAHEKVNFERYMKEIEENAIVIQPLLVPEVIELSMDDYEVYRENSEVIKNAGFTLEEFGGRSIRAVEVPYFLGRTETGIYIGEILDNLKNLGRGTGKEVKYMKIATAACKASVKAKDSLSLHEMEKLTDALRYLDEPFTCPHGRPTMIKITVRELEKMFRRV